MTKFPRGYSDESCLSAAIAGAITLAALPVFTIARVPRNSTPPRSLTCRAWSRKLNRTNPHAHFYMDVTDASGKVTNWNFELASPNVLIRNGWKRNSVKEGDKVSVTGSQAKDNSNLGTANTITFPDGHKLNFLYAEEPAK